MTAEHVHGADGFAGTELPEPTLKPAAGFALDAIVDIVMSRPERSVTMCCLAPLTNLALALAREPRLAARLERIVLMGGRMAKAATSRPRPNTTSGSIPKRRAPSSLASRRSS